MGRAQHDTAVLLGVWGRRPVAPESSAARLQRRYRERATDAEQQPERPLELVQHVVERIDEAVGLLLGRDERRQDLQARSGDRPRPATRIPWSRNSGTITSCVNKPAAHRLQQRPLRAQAPRLGPAELDADHQAAAAHLVHELVPFGHVLAARRAATRRSRPPVRRSTRRRSCAASRARRSSRARSGRTSSCARRPGPSCRTPSRRRRLFAITAPTGT